MNGVDSVSDETVKLGGLLRQPVQDNLAVRPCEDVGGWDREDFHSVVKEFGEQECTLEFCLGNVTGATQALAVIKETVVDPSSWIERRYRAVP